MTKKPKPDEEWVRYDTVTVNADDLPDWMRENDRALRSDPAFIAAADRAVEATLLDAIPPAGRSTHDRSALAREPSYTNRDPGEPQPYPYGASTDDALVREAEIAWAAWSRGPDEVKPRRGNG